MEKPRAVQYNHLNSAKRHKSKTRPFPFLIAHECHKPYKNRETGAEEVRTREYFAFDSAEDFISVRDEFPHAHEIIWDRLTAGKQQGRLIFDFDFDEPWYGVRPYFVSPDFESIIEKLVVSTFTKFYEGVDTSRFVFIWLVSDLEQKWSKHLIVKNAFFCEDWKEQSLVFYNLMLALAEDNSPFPKLCSLEISKLIDIQVARENATMRFLGSCKLKPTEKSGRGKVLLIEKPEGVNFFDTTVQLHRYQDVTNEQHICSRQLCKNKLEAITLNDEGEMKKIKNKFYQAAFKHAEIETESFYEHDDKLLEETEIENAFSLFEEHYCRELGISKQKGFKLKSCKGRLVHLVRVAPSKCLLSGRIHDRSNAFLIIKPDGEVHFHCLRGCQRLIGSSIKSSVHLVRDKSNSVREQIMESLKKK